MIEVHYDRGVYLPKQNVWMDPWEAKEFAFVSHAHGDHIAPHSEIVLSERTARLMRLRLPGDRIEHALAFGENRSVRGVNLTLIPAGHIFGSAQCLICADEGTLLYTGDFKLRPGKSAEQAEWRHADILVMETTFGLPRYRFPPTKLVMNQMVAFCSEAIDSGEVPVLLGYSLGKAQEILCSLDGVGLMPMLHGSIFRITRIYEQFGQSFCKYLRYNPNDVAGKVLICPPSANCSEMLERIPRKRVALVSGWAVDPNTIYRHRVDAAFPLSDHADYDDLLRYVELVQPRRVLTLHGFAAAFACDLRRRGIEAWALSQENQMELHFESKDVPPRCAAIPVGPSPTPREPMVESEFLRFARVGEAVAATPAKSEKIRLVSDYIRSLPSEQLPIAARYFTGRAFAQSDARVLQIGWAVIFRALQAATRIDDAEFHRIAASHGDAGKTALETLEGRTAPRPFSIVESADLFNNLQRVRGPIAKAKLLEERFSILSAREGQYVVKILTGDLRIGLREGLVEEAIATGFGASLEEVKHANMLLGDIGSTALLASQKELKRAELSMFRPIKCMLATPEPNADAVWGRFIEAKSSAIDRELGSSSQDTVYVEDKFDGIRAQLHRARDRIEIFSRDLRRVTGQFPELVEEAMKFDPELIADGEIIAFAEGRRLTFFDLQKRLGRKDENADLFARATANVPVVFVMFDLLWINGRSLLENPLQQRREQLGRLVLPPKFLRANVTAAHSSKEIEQIFQRARQRLNEGLMIKDPDSFYLPGTRGMHWFKLKRELATLDVVVVAAELGHGKRNRVLSDYTFAVRDEISGELLPIGKAYSGLTDVEISELTEHFKQNTIADHGRYCTVKPDVVLEIAFNAIQPSTRHASGLALRFPRIKAIRRDKNVDSIDTIQYARELARQSSISPSHFEKNA
ncbi:MAG TPA: ATP-dependent DNA ligase [Candidatus Udaeobacter sp.]|nr:ATP-dependent DNA ligase [Candidatus Udaeobacter sp.]